MRKIFFLIGFLVLILAACENSATARGVRNECRNTGVLGNNTSTCQLTIDSVQGTRYTYSVENDSFRTSTNAAEVKMKITVGNGSLLVWVEDPQNQQTSAAVAPGETVELNGVARISGTSSNRSFKINIEPQGEGETRSAEDISIEYEYSFSR